MSDSRFQVRHVRWWHRPRPLYQRKEGEDWVQVGWVWNQRSYMVNNLNYGWIAFVDQQTPENIDVWFCPKCGSSLWGSVRDKIEKAMALQKDQS